MLGPQGWPDIEWRHYAASTDAYSDLGRALHSTFDYVLLHPTLHCGCASARGLEAVAQGAILSVAHEVPKVTRHVTRLHGGIAQRFR